MGTRNTQDDAFKFCKGKAIKKSTGPASVLSPRGRVAGENDDPYALTLEFTYYWN
jgi:hypothetical protein